MHCSRSEGDFCDEDGNALKLASLFLQQTKMETAKGTVSASPGPVSSELDFNVKHSIHLKYKNNKMHIYQYSDDRSYEDGMRANAHNTSTVHIKYTSDNEQC